MIKFAIRRLRPSDSLDELTRLLHRAFDALVHDGLVCECSHQTLERTRQRAARGECFVAVCEGQVIGTMTLEGPDRCASIGTYRDAGTASIHQLAVDPSRQREGVGCALVVYAASWARARRFKRLALDTPEAAHHQVAWYFDRGFQLAETVHVAGRRYASVVLAMPIIQLARPTRPLGNLQLVRP